MKVITGQINTARPKIPVKKVYLTPLDFCPGGDRLISETYRFL
jgi:hypothetical protein